MRVTFTGHAGMLVEAGGATILCDPWFNPAYFGSWYPFPSNHELDRAELRDPDFVYLSHLHGDHLDRAFLLDEVSKDTTVLLPDYPTRHMRRELESLGFSQFIQTRQDRPVDLGGPTVTIHALTTPTDGPIGDSGLVVLDGSARLFDQNDSRPVDLDPILALGPYDAHLLQFSGAIWYPLAYRLPDPVRQVLGRAKRSNQMARAYRYAREVDARLVIPFAGPPCFLDDDLFHLNDFDDDDTNIFPDQQVFIEHLQQQGFPRAELVVPGSVLHLEGGDHSVEHPGGSDGTAGIFGDKRSYLKSYQDWARPLIDKERAGWPVPQLDIVAELRAWWGPLIAGADLTCSGINGRLLLEAGDVAVVVDFLDRRIAEWNGAPCRYRFRIPRPLVEQCILDRTEDWVNALFLSCRFEAERDGPYNEYVYTFFKSLSAERMAYVEGYYAEDPPVQELWECDGYLVQRRCPHLQADLTRFGRVEDGVLTCQLHGWQFELETGRCLTSDDRRIYAKRPET